MREFLRTRAYPGKEDDDRVAVARISAEGGPDVKAAASEALDGTAADGGVPGGRAVQGPRGRRPRGGRPGPRHRRSPRSRPRHRPRCPVPRTARAATTSAPSTASTWAVYRPHSATSGTTADGSGTRSSCPATASRST
ncbi:ALF repeat-containing protein [Streptomyces sp. TRM72054]|uniref:ALF repeat-containing protein n=1 Tax=Streptomyces sp. TRM72054 TaxID=2870562 RepID=UPI0027E089EB|nr:ALF repeat-containing protein [Streptomyces sp. TRM72054]